MCPPGKKKILVRIWMLSYENWGSYDHLKIKKKKNKKYTQAWDPAGNKISGL